MAKAISNIEKNVPNEVEERAQAMKTLLNSTTESAEALVVFLDILKHLHQLGVLEAVRALLQNSHDVARIGVTAMNKPGMHHVMKNAIGAVQFLGKIEPAQMQTVLNSVAAGFAKTADAENQGKHMGVWDMMKLMRDTEINSTVGLLVNFLRGMGESLNGSQPQTH